MGKLKVLSESRYARLVADVRKLIVEGRARAKTAVQNELVQTYWQVGKRINDEGLMEKSSYGDSVVEDLSDELGIDELTLRRSVAFFKAYKVSPRGNNLTWSHFRELLNIKESKVRSFYETQAEKNEWTRDQLVKAISQRKHETSLSDGTKKVSKTLKRPTQATYVYKAEVDRIIDGDTLLLSIDLGFQVWKEQRIRLAEIDAPAMDETGGKEAKRYVSEQLAKAEYIMVMTHKIDIYGRYVGHVFYSLDAKKDKEDIFKTGRYLNQELLSRGLASTV